MRYRRLRTLLFLIGVLTLIVLLLLAGFGGARSTPYALAIAVVSTVLALVNTPALRPPGKSVARSAAAIRVGRTLIVVAWSARALVVGVVAYLVASRLDQPPGFDRQAAAFAVLSLLLLLLAKVGRWCVGFPATAKVGRFVAVLRWLVNSTIAVLLAGYAAVIPQLLSDPGPVLDTLTRDSDVAPVRLYRLLADLATPWVAVPATIILCVLALWLASVLLGLLLRGLAIVLGRGNPISQWLSENAAVWYERTDTDVRFVSRFVIKIDYYNSWAHRHLDVRFFGLSYRQDNLALTNPFRRRRKRPQVPLPVLSAQEETELLDGVVAEVVTRVPDDWRSLRLVYRAVLGHQETEVIVDPPADVDPDDFVEPDDLADSDDPAEPVGDAEPQVVPLSDLSANDALWRLREAKYQQGYGAPYVLTVDIERQFAAGSPPTVHWQLSTTVPYASAEPAWRRRPTRRQYRADLRRFPIDPWVRPFWLRARLSWFG